MTRWTVRDVLGWTTQHFAKLAIDSPRLTAEVLLAHALCVDRVRLYIDLDRPLDEAERARYRGFIERRAAGEPTAYVVGEREFYKRPFKVDARVLVPRPETELLVDAVLKELPRDAPSRVLDLCAGSGCIAVTLAKERDQVSVLASDLSDDACAVARENAERHEVASRVTVRAGDLFAAVPEGARFDVIVANPPYIRGAEIAKLAREVQKEPRLALDGGADGLEVIRRLAAGARQHLGPGGLLAFEIGDDQGDAVRDLLAAGGYAGVRIEKDLARLDRLAFARQPGHG